MFFELVLPRIAEEDAAVEIYSHLVISDKYQSLAVSLSVKLSQSLPGSEIIVILSYW